MHYNVDTLYVNWGDVDSDGYITNADAQKLSKFIAEDRNVRLTDAEKRRADVDTDGKITTDDVVAILLRASSGKFSWAK
jgi:Ca2+-binding EF-hand superfamily protein